MRIPKSFKTWFKRHALSKKSHTHGTNDAHNWTSVRSALGISTSYYMPPYYRAYCYGVRHERARAKVKIDALEAEIKQNYIDEIISDTYSGSDKLLDSACNNSSAIGLRKLAEWGIVTIEQDYGRRVIAHMNEEPAPHD